MRDYHPVVARWTRKDPIAFGGLDVNLYAYAGNDPLNNIDSEGRIFGRLSELVDDWADKHIKHGVARGQIHGVPEAWLGDLYGHGGVSSLDPCISLRTPRLDVDAIRVNGRWVHVFGSVIVDPDDGIRRKEWWWSRWTRPLTRGEREKWMREFPDLFDEE